MSKSYYNTVHEAHKNKPTVNLRETVSMNDTVNTNRASITQYINTGAKAAMGAIANARQTYWDPSTFTGGFNESYEVGKNDTKNFPKVSTSDQRLGAAKSVHNNARESWDDY